MDRLIRYFAGFSEYSYEGFVEPWFYNEIATILFRDSYSRVGPLMGDGDEVQYSVDTSEIIFPHVPGSSTGTVALTIPLSGNQSSGVPVLMSPISSRRSAMFDRTRSASSSSVSGPRR